MQRYIAQGRLWGRVHVNYQALPFILLASVAMCMLAMPVVAGAVCKDNRAAQHIFCDTCMPSEASMGWSQEEVYAAASTTHSNDLPSHNPNSCHRTESCSQPCLSSEGNEPMGMSLRSGSYWDIGRIGYGGGCVDHVPI